MFRSVGVAEVHGLLLVVHKNENGIIQRLGCNLLAGKALELLLYLLLYLVEHLF